MANPSEIARAEDEADPFPLDPAPAIEMATAADLTPDPKNANKGTRRGRAMLEKSIERLGGGRSVLLDKNNVLIAGNKTMEVAGEKGLPVMIVETDGECIVAVRRKDLDMADPKDTRAQELALADNRVAQEDLEWDVDVLKELQGSGMDLSEWGLDKVIDRDASSTKGVGDLDRAVQLRPEREYVVIMCDANDDGIEWERLKEALNLQPVRRGGYKAGSQFDAVGTQRVVRARDLLDKLAPKPEAEE